MYYKVNVNQNYFQFDEQYYKPNKGTAMGSPHFGIAAEMYIEHF
jgi:hypothetical protein